MNENVFVFLRRRERGKMIKLQDVIDVYAIVKKLSAMHVRPHVSSFS